MLLAVVSFWENVYGQFHIEILALCMRKPNFENIQWLRNKKLFLTYNKQLLEEISKNHSLRIAKRLESL